MAGVSRTAAESWLELLVIKVNGWKLLSSVNRNAGQATDNLRNSDILIQLCDYRVCAVVSTKQWFSIGGGKHIVWISLY